MIKSADPLTMTGAYSNYEIGRLTDVFKLLADRTRLKIILLLTENEELHVNALCAELGQSQPAVSHHLALLRAGKIIELRREGKYNFYRVSGDDAREQVSAFFNLTFSGDDRSEEARSFSDRLPDSSIITTAGV